MTNQPTDNELGGHEESPYICPICKGYADNGHDRCLPPNAYLCTKCTESPAVQAEVGGGSNSQDGACADAAKPAPASPLPRFDDVAQVIRSTQTPNEQEVDAHHFLADSRIIAQAIQSLYREHFAGWLQSVATRKMIMRNGFKMATTMRLTKLLEKAVRESGDL